MTDTFTTDSWGVVINGSDTYNTIATYMGRSPNSLVINWTDCRGTMYVILFTMGAAQNGDIGHTFHPALPMGRVMFVSIMRVGTFGFDMMDGFWVAPTYVEEKLGVFGATAEAIAQLINGVKTAYTGQPHEAPQASPPPAEEPDEESDDGIKVSLED